MQLKVALPEGMWGRKTQVKPLVDGVAVALQWQPEEAIVPLLADHLDVPSEEVTSLLHMDKGAVLGQHQSFQRWRDGLKANPRDDLCVALDVEVGATSRAFPSLALCVFGVSKSR
jgi:hypothetical protein